MKTEIEAMQSEVDNAIALTKLDAEIRHKAMFGGACSYANDRIFSSLSNVGIGLKLSPEDRDALLLIEGAKPVQYDPDMPPSKTYFVVPESVRQSPSEFASWVEKSVKYVLTLPSPKKKTKSSGV